MQEYSHSHFFLRLRPCLYGEKLSRVEGSPAYPSYPGRANFSYISLQNLANLLYEKQKVGLARRVTRLAGSSFCDGRVTLLAGPTFLGSCVFCAPLDRYIGRHLSRHIDRHSTNASVDISAECRPICRSTYRSSVGRYVNWDVSVDISTDVTTKIWAEWWSTYRSTIGRYLGQYSSQHLPDTLTIDFGGISVDRRWYIGQKLTL